MSDVAQEEQRSSAKGEKLEVDATSEVNETFDRTVEEGAARLNRSWSNMLSTGLMAGFDVGFGVLALLFVEHETGSVLLGGLAFTVGFLALALGRGELFTENFLVPVTTVITRKASSVQLLKFWSVTYVANLAGGWVIAALVVLGYPDLHETAISRGEEIVDRSFTVESFVLAVLAGAAITLMTWMERNSASEGGRLAAVLAFGFLLAATHMNHVVVISLKMFAALQAGIADFGYLDWLGLSTYAVAGNIVGGLGLVTVLRLVQIGPRHIQRRQRSSMTIKGENGRKRIRGER